jgi:hypothetical protein
MALLPAVVSDLYSLEAGQQGELSIPAPEVNLISPPTRSYPPEAFEQVENPHTLAGLPENDVEDTKTSLEGYVEAKLHNVKLHIEVDAIMQQ